MEPGVARHCTTLKHSQRRLACCSLAKQLPECSNTIPSWRIPGSSNAQPTRIWRRRDLRQDRETVALCGREGRDAKDPALPGLTDDKCGSHSENQHISDRCKSASYCNTSDTERARRRFSGIGYAALANKGGVKTTKKAAECSMQRDKTYHQHSTYTKGDSC